MDRSAARCIISDPEGTFLFLASWYKEEVVGDLVDSFC